jgi:hypothetical protein
MKSLCLVVQQPLSNLILYEHYCVPGTGTDEFSLCTPDNITIIPKYRTSDSLCYLVSRCNYCGKQWGEF